MSDLKLGLQLGYWTGQGPEPGEQIAAAQAAEGEETAEGAAGEGEAKPAEGAEISPEQAPQTK